MSYAIRKDGQGCRAVSSADDCMDHETFSEAAPVVDMDKLGRINAIQMKLLGIDARTPRAMREALLSGDKSRVQAMESEAAALRTELASLAT